MATLILLLFLTGSLVSCAKSPGKSLPSFGKVPTSTVSVSKWAKAGLAQLSAGNYRISRQLFAKGLRYQPQNCPLNFFNALSYHYQGRGGDEKSLNMAAIGYRIAIKYCPQDPWAHYYYGLLLFSRKNYPAAEMQFSLASRYAPSKIISKFIEAYMVAAYNAGDNATAKRLLGRLKRLDKNSPLVKEVSNALNRKTFALPQPAAQQKRQYARYKKSRPRPLKRQKKQVFVDAVLIENREVSETSRGVNLLDGLSIQYGNGSTPGFAYSNSTFSNLAPWAKYAAAAGDGASYPTVSFPNLITNTISIPAVKYSLNIFNNNTNRAEILARPSLIAENGKTATYFSGRKLILGITGDNSGTIQTFPVGLSMNLTPHFLKDGSMNLKVEVGVDFLSDVANRGNKTTFSQVAEEISQKTTTTVNLRFGETAILSAMSTDIIDQNNNKTPMLGDLPLVKYFFHKKQDEKQNVSILILLTPERYINFRSPQGGGNTSSQAAQLYFNKLVEPRTNLMSTLHHLSGISLYARPDLSLPALNDSTQLNHAVRLELHNLTQSSEN